MLARTSSGRTETGRWKGLLLAGAGLLAFLLPGAAGVAYLALSRSPIHVGNYAVIGPSCDARKLRYERAIAPGKIRVTFLMLQGEPRRARGLRWKWGPFSVWE